MSNAKRIYKSFTTTNANRTNSGLIFNEDVIKEDVVNLVRTKKGEFPMDVNRGCLINDYHFEHSLSTSDEMMIKDDMYEQLSSDPRIEIVDIKIFSLNNNSSLALVLDLKTRPFNTDIQLTINFEE